MWEKLICVMKISINLTFTYTIKPFQCAIYWENERGNWIHLYMWYMCCFDIFNVRNYLACFGKPKEAEKLGSCQGALAKEGFHINYT